MHRNIAVRREAQGDGQHTIPRGRRLSLTECRPTCRPKPPEGAKAEGATTPETLRQKDREGDELLESGPVFLPGPTEGVIPALRSYAVAMNGLRREEISQVPMTEGSRTAGFGGTRDSN